MKIPKIVSIGAHEIKVKGVMFPDETTGSFQRFEELIQINSEAPESAQAEALLHEILHGVNTIFKLELTHDQIYVLSESLFQVMRHNDLDFTYPTMKAKKGKKAN